MRRHFLPCFAKNKLFAHFCIVLLGLKRKNGEKKDAEVKEKAQMKSKKPKLQGDFCTLF